MPKRKKKRQEQEEPEKEKEAAPIAEQGKEKRQRPDPPRRSNKIGCHVCGRNFYWKRVAGYSDCPLEGYYCGKCLRDYGFTVADVMYSASEASHLDAYFASEGRQFNRKAVARDGACMLRCVWEGLSSLGFKSYEDMVVGIARVTIEVIQEQQEGEEECVAVWEDIIRKADALKELWDASDALDYTWLGLCRIAPQIRVQVWQWHESELKLLQSYPEEQERNGDRGPILATQHIQNIHSSSSSSSH